MALLCKEMKSKSIENMVFCVESIGKNSLYSTKTKIIVSKVSSGLKLSFLSEIYTVIKESDANIVHVWLPAVISIPGMFFAKTLGKKVVFSFRNRMFFHRLLSYPEFLCALFFSDQIVSNHEISDSNKLYKWLYKIKNGVVINNGVNIGKYKRRKRIVKGKKTIRFIYVGRLTEQKNPIKLLKALSLVKDCNWILDIYGEGTLKNELVKLVEYYKMSGSVFFYEFSDCIYSKMVNADALLFPSRYEGTPNVLIEAMSMRLPVLASFIEANKRVVGSLPGFYWLNPDDAEDMSETIESFLKDYDDTDFFHLLRRCELIAQRYSAKSMVSKYEKLYLKILGESVKNEVTH